MRCERNPVQITVRVWQYKIKSSLSRVWSVSSIWVGERVATQRKSHLSSLAAAHSPPHNSYLCWQINDNERFPIKRLQNFMAEPGISLCACSPSPSTAPRGVTSCSFPTRGHRASRSHGFMLHRGDRGELSAWRVVATRRREVLAKDLPRFRTGKKTKHIPRQHHNVRICFRRRGLRPSWGPDSAISGVLPNIRLPPTLLHTAGARGDDSGDCARLFRKWGWGWHRDEDEARGGVVRRWHGEQLRWWHRLSLTLVGLLQN